MTISAARSRLGRGARRIGAVAKRRGYGRRADGWGSRLNPRWTRPWHLVALAAVVAVAVAFIVRNAGKTSTSGLGWSTVRVGVSDGDWVPGYVSAQRAELAQLLTRRPTMAVYALVSFDTYLTPSELTATVGTGVSVGTSVSAGMSATGVEPFAAYARVPLPARQTELVRLSAHRMPDDLLAGMAAVADRKVGEAAGYTARAGQDDASRSLYQSMASVAAREATAYRGACACVYALVVRAAPVVLVALASRTGVRVVDAAPEVIDIGHAVFVAPLPEVVDVVRPLPVG